MNKEDILINVLFMFRDVITSESDDVILMKVSAILENFVDDYDFSFDGTKPDIIVDIER